MIIIATPHHPAKFTSTFTFTIDGEFGIVSVQT